MKRSILLAALVAACALGADRKQAPVPAARIAAGKPVWIASHPDTPELNAKVDVGRLKAVGDEIEVVIKWPLAKTLLESLATQEKLSLPEGTIAVDTERVECRATGGLLFYTVRSTLVTPDGKTAKSWTYQPKERRETAERGTGISDYGHHPRAVVCWALARKCEGKEVVWPPPKDAKPEQYVPSCKLR